MKRPTFFLSSTIYDFRDLRSAIKFSLEERGCKVLASEFNDFGGPLDQHSYERCLTNIEQADYFVLLIGGRVGGWYDQQERTSITQQEYRTAYNLHQQGQLKIITLVRKEVWQLREDRNSLAKHLETMNFDETERKAVISYPNKFATDSEFISEFISEVGRNIETGTAVREGTVKPTGNWIHVFDDFRDIQDVLSPLTFSGLTADEAAFSKALQHELLTITAQFLLKLDGEPLDPRNSLKKRLAKLSIDKVNRLDESVTVNNKEWKSYSFIMLQLHAIKIYPVICEEALASSLFLTFDRNTGKYEHSSTYEALFQLVNEIRQFESSATSECLSVIYEFSTQRIGKPVEFEMPVAKLARLHHITHRWINILSLSIALAVHLEQGEEFIMPDLMPFSPIKDMDEEIEKERLSVDEVRKALGI